MKAVQQATAASSLAATTLSDLSRPVGSSFSLSPIFGVSDSCFSLPVLLILPAPQTLPGS